MLVVALPVALLCAAAYASRDGSRDAMAVASDAGTSVERAETTSTTAAEVTTTTTTVVDPTTSTVRAPKVTTTPAPAVPTTGTAPLVIRDRARSESDIREDNAGGGCSVAARSSEISVIVEGGGNVSVSARWGFVTQGKYYSGAAAMVLSNGRYRAQVRFGDTPLTSASDPTTTVSPTSTGPPAPPTSATGRIDWTVTAADAATRTWANSPSDAGTAITLHGC